MTGRRPDPSRRHRLGLLLALVGALSGCGYTLRGTLPDHIKTVAVPVFVNRTSEPAVENLLTRAVVEAFSTNGRLQVVSPAEADAVLEGEVVGYEVQSVAFDSGANVRQYRLLVTLNLRFRDVRRNAVLFEQAGVQERADFRVLGAVAQTFSREESALRQAAVDIARAVVSLAVERF
jgi:outer membrane lipopolysaccharide assembly protein LptE/RlpB